MLSINEAAHKLTVHRDTLRRIERSGVFIPQRTRAGARRYTAEDVEALRAILYPAARTARSNGEVVRG
jgi:DNA-binding transcriptional MerR regulator